MFPRFYNHTEYSGLETHITNSYTNPLLQLLHYTYPIRTLARSHIATDCQREYCLFCELGFMVAMLQDAHGTNCQSTNFCKTVGVLATSTSFETFPPLDCAHASIANNLIDLMDYGIESPDHNYAHMIQSFHRFLMDTLAAEGNAPTQNPWLVPRQIQSDGGVVHDDLAPNPAPSPITQLCGVDAKNIITCGSCGAVREKENMVHVTDLVYPKKVCCSNIFLRLHVLSQRWLGSSERPCTPVRPCVHCSVLHPPSHDTQGDVYKLLQAVCYLREPQVDRE